MAIKVNLENQNRKRKINLTLLEKIAKKTLKELSKVNSEVNIVFVSNQKIRAINRKYLKRDTSTDVIAFSSEGDKVLKKIKGQSQFLGDIAISSDKAYLNAKKYNVTFKEELALYIIHGILHILGYRDTTAKTRMKMQKKENGLLQKIRKTI